MSNMIKQLMAEYGFLAEDADIERNVKDQITRAQTKDEVDTIAFGLETDDGMIVKVYVNAEHAEQFEQAMAEMLGKVDDIEEALNQLSKDIEIVDVEWPDEAEEDGEADEVDPDADDELETDGSEVLNSKVHSKENKKKEAQANEQLSYGDELTMSLLEAGSNSIADQLSTVNQHLIYQAILHLGVPELAMDKSPYRSAILKGIKGTALELAHTPAMRNTLKIFIKQQAIDDKKAPDEETHRGDAAKSRHHADTYEKGMKAAGVVGPREKAKQQERTPSDVKAGKDESKSKYEVKEAEDNSAPHIFWGAVGSVMGLLDGTEGKELVSKVMDSQSFKSLLARSRTRVTGRLTAGVRTKIAALTRAIEMTSGETAVTEQYTYIDAQEMLATMLKIADDSKGELVNRITASQVFKRLVLSGRTAFVNISTTVKRALQQLDSELKKVALAEADELSFDEPKGGAEQQEPEKELAASDASDAAPPPAPAPDASESGVSFEADGDSLKATYPGGSFELSGENLERALKALNNKQTLSVQLDGGKFATFSPRGSSAVIKLMGSEKVIKLAPPDISAFIDAGAQVAEGDPENEPVKESLERAHILVETSFAN